MRAGRMDKRVEIQQPVSVPDGAGGQTVTWTTFDTIWASIEPLQGQEYIAAQQMQTAVTHRLRIRYLEGITAAMRVKFGARVFQIQSILNYNERNAEMQLMCVEQTEGT
jgi:SPP1 family predicted phage head-tail adaptor